MSGPDAITAVIADVRAIHTQDPQYPRHCMGCTQGWPCEAEAAAQALEAQQARIAVLEAERGETMAALEPFGKWGRLHHPRIESYGEVAPQVGDWMYAADVWTRLSRANVGL